MLKRTGKVASEIYEEISKTLKYLLKRIEIKELDLRGFAEAAEVQLHTFASQNAPIDLSFPPEIALEPLPEAEPIILDIDLSYEPKYVQLLTGVGVNVQPLVMDDLVLTTTASDVWLKSLKPIYHTPEEFEIKSTEVPIEVFKTAVATMEKLKTSVKNGLFALKKRAKTTSSKMSFARSIPMRRNRLALHHLSEDQHLKLWRHLLNETGLPPERLAILGVFDNIPVKSVKKVVAQEEGKYVNLFLKAGYTGKPVLGKLILARNKQTGELVKSLFVDR